jgi:hypothetical protein
MVNLTTSGRGARMDVFFLTGISVPGNQGSFNYLHMGSCVGGLCVRPVLDLVTLTPHKTRLGLAFKRQDS